VSATGPQGADVRSRVEGERSIINFLFVLKEVPICRRPRNSSSLDPARPEDAFLQAALSAAQGEGPRDQNQARKSESRNPS
jgi:hypothetical protein